MASVGQPAAESSVASTDSGSTGSTGGSGSTGSADGSGGTSGSGASGGASGTTTVSGGAQGPTGLGRVPVLATAGNALLDVGDRADAARGPLDANLANSAPVTGTVTQVLRDTGQALVRSGDGSTYLVDGLRAAPGSAVTIDSGDGRLVGGANSTPLIGVSVLSPSQAAGTLATAGVGANGNLLTANVPGNPAVGGLPATATGAAGATGTLANVAAGTTQVVGGGQPAAIGVSALSPTQSPGTALTAGVATGGNLATVNGTSVASGTAGNLLGGIAPGVTSPATTLGATPVNVTTPAVSVGNGSGTVAAGPLTLH